VSAGTRLASEQIELTVADAAQEGGPLGATEQQDAPVEIFAVADPYAAVAQVGGFDAVAVGSAERTLDP
jgi:hypothetical protein